MPISTSGLAQDFSRVPIRATRVPVIQTKLIVRQPDDKYEQEADRIAAKVVNQINAPQPPQSIQRKSILGKLTTADISIMRRKAGEPVDVNQNIEQSIQGSRGKGQPLADNIRGSMEQAFGADFSGVKIHADGKSDQLNHSLSARAFTTGQDIFFKQGEYNPESQQGQELLAHELTHVVQQTGAINRKSTSEQPKTPKVNKGKRESQQTLEVSLASEIIQRREVWDASGVSWSEAGSDESFYSQEPNASYSTDVGTLAEPTQVQEEDPNKPVFEAYKGKSINKIAHVSAPSREYPIAKTSGVKIRAKPDGTLPHIARVIYDTEVQVLALDNTGAFYFIIANTGAVGWINKHYVVLDPPDVGSHLHHISESNLATILKNEYVDKGLWTLSTGNDYTTLAAAVVVANEGLKGVSVDWEKAQKYKNENLTKGVFDPWTIDNFAIYHGSKILEGHNIWLPSPDYVRMLQSSGLIGSRPDWINMAVDTGKGSTGFFAGIVSGVFGSLWDMLAGLWELGKGIVTTVKSALDGSLFASIKSIYDTVTSMTWEGFKNMVDEVITMGKNAFTNFRDQWNHADTYKMWHFRGYTIGAIALEIVLAIFTGGGTLGAKVLAKIGKYFPKLERILNKLLKVADELDFRRQRDKGRGAQSQDRDRKDDHNRDQDDENMSNDDRAWEQARVMAALVTEAHDTMDTPVETLIPLLNTTIAVKYKGVRGYRAIPQGAPNTYTIIQTSRRRDVDNHYTEKEKESQKPQPNSSLEGIRNVANPRDEGLLNSIRERLSQGNRKLQELDKGGFGTIYQIPDHPDLVIKLATESQGGINPQLVKEATNLFNLAQKGYPTVYKGLIEWVEPNGMISQGIVMQKVEGALSKRILRTGKFENEPRDTSLEAMVTPKTLEDLEKFKEIAEMDDIIIDDIQFMISKRDGSISLIDPARVHKLPYRGDERKKMKRQYQRRIDKLIKEFSDLLTNNQR